MTATAIDGHGHRFFYVDDSGSPDDGHILYSWIEVTDASWTAGLGHWLDLRKHMYATFSVPPAHELHGSALLGGRGRPSIDPTFNGDSACRRALAETALQAIGGNPYIRIGTIYRVTELRGKEYARERAQLYSALVSHWDGRLLDSGEYATVFMDGNGSDPSYSRAHRGLELASRRVLEDPLFQGSHASQWVQMADLVAWTAYQAIRRRPGKQYAWDWYDKHLAGIDLNGGPIRL